MKKRQLKKNLRRFMRPIVDGLFMKSPLMPQLRHPERYRLVPGRVN